VTFFVLKRWRLAAKCAAAFLFPGFLLLLPRPLFPDVYSTALHDRRGALLGAFTARDGQWRIAPGDSVPERFSRCVQAAEDSRFRFHPGIDLFAVARAIRVNFRHNRRVQGGSTITQQVARLSRRAWGFHGHRGFAEKALEALWALRLEATWSKREILAQWAAHAPFGGNVVGLEAAAWRWYGKAPESLSWGEAASLAALPNSPARLGSVAGQAPLRARRDWILLRLLQSGQIDSMEWSLARSEPLPGAARPLPSRAPHLAELVRAQGPGLDWRSEIDGTVQDDIGRLAADQVRDLRGIGAHSLSVIAVELVPGHAPAVRAWIGDAAAHDGVSAPVDMVLAPRSTGSTLKPFLYALALDRGHILPAQWLPDVPARWGDFRPRNSDGAFSGMVPADQALARSLNVPWARVLEEMGPASLLDLLRRSGARHLFRGADAYGVPLVLGGGELCLAELAGLYAMLGNRGTSSPLDLAHSGKRFLHVPGPGEDREAPSLKAAHEAFLAAFGEEGRTEQILSPEASWLALEALRKPGRIDEEESWKAFSGGRPLAWKTGTSWGQRDAWAIGVSPRWVVGVWAGNPGGEGRPGLWGSHAAAPLLFRLFPLLPDSGSSRWFERPAHLQAVGICPETGWRRSALCPPGSFAWAPAAGLAAPLDKWHREVHLDSSGLYQVDGNCEPAHRQVVKSWLVLPPAADAYLREAHPDLVPRLPPFRSDCREPEGSDAIDILVPENGARLTLPVDLDGQRQRVVVELRHRRSLPVRCFLDGTDLGLSTLTPVWAVQPKPGTHELLCEDAQGVRAASRFSVDWSEERPKRATRR
jgi:penicillin-binding protein 1C